MFGSFSENGKNISFGFYSVKDWVTSVIFSFPAPWSLAPLEGYYYGTVILDAEGFPLLSFWHPQDSLIPSWRQKEALSPWTQEAWEEYCCDSHWEAEETLAMAEKVINLRNHGDHWDSDVLTSLIIEFGKWEEEAWDLLLSGGGPNKRVMPWDERCPETIRRHSRKPQR